MEFMQKIPLKIFQVIPSSLLAIIFAIVIEFAIVRPMGDKTQTIRDVSEFTSDTAFPIPFFIDHKSTDYDFSNLGSSESIIKICVQGFLLCLVGSIESLMTSEA